MQHLMYNTEIKENKMTNFLTGIGALVVALFVIVIFGLLVSLPIMWIWNLCLVPALTVVKPIGWLQAWGIMVLCSTLFKTTVSKK